MNTTETTDDGYPTSWADIERRLQEIQAKVELYDMDGEKRLLDQMRDLLNLARHVAQLEGYCEGHQDADNSYRPQVLQLVSTLSDVQNKAALALGDARALQGSLALQPPQPPTTTPSE